MKRNPYEGRKKPGVRGIVSNNFKVDKIYDKGEEAVSLFIGRLDEGAYDFGYDIHSLNNNHLIRIPGVGSGWFSSENDATGYGLYAIKIAFYNALSKEAKLALDNKINSFSTPKLDLI